MPPKKTSQKDDGRGTPPAKRAGRGITSEMTSLSKSQVRAILIGIMLAMFLGALEQTIVATALPTIGRSFNDLQNLPWIVTAYLLAGTAVTPLYGKLSDIHGRRATLLSAILLFLAGSVACALAPNMTTLIGARALQGLGGGGLMSLAQTVIADIFTPRERGRLQGYIGTVFAVSSLGGPVLGGLLTEHLHWSTIFWINLPLGLAALAMTNRALKFLPKHGARHKLDYIGAVLMASAAIALLLAMTWGGTRFPWISPPIGALLGASALLWGLFAWRIATAPEPFLPLAVLGNPVVRSASLAGACCMGVLVGLTIYTPLYFETVMHYSASQSGLALIPLAAGTVASSTLTGRFMTSVERYKRMPLAGLVLGILTLGALAIWPVEMPVWAILSLTALIGIALGSVFPVSTVAMQNAVTRAHVGTATGAANFFRALISALVVALFGAIVLGGLGGAAGVSIEALARMASGADLATAFRFVFVAAMLVLCFSLCFTIAMEEKPLQGPAAKEGAPPEPVSPIGPEPPVQEEKRGKKKGR
jgi:EmrB/QacA subfamily drug resistance transporter